VGPARRTHEQFGADRRIRSGDLGLGKTTLLLPSATPRFLSVIPAFRSSLGSPLLACSDTVSKMSPRLRRNCGVARGTLPTSLFLPTCRAFGRIDELACVAALLAISPLENSSPVHPANFLQRSRQVAGGLAPVSRMSPNRPPTSRRPPEEASLSWELQIPCTPRGASGRLNMPGDAFEEGRPSQR